MASRSSFLPRLSLLRQDDSSVLPLHNSTSRYPPLRSEGSEYDLDDLSPKAEDGLISSEFYDPNAQKTVSGSNRKPTGALNRRPSNSSTGSKQSKRRNERAGGVMFAGPPPPIAMSRVFHRDGEEQYDDHHMNDGAASWLPGTARKAIESVIWDRAATSSSQNRGDAPVVYDRNSIWRSLQRRERAIVADVQTFLQIQEESLSGGRSFEDGYSSGSATPTGTSSSMAASSTGRLRKSTIEPLVRSGPGGEIIPVRQPRRKRLGITGARKGIARSMEQLANLKAEEEASILSALSTRKQGLAKLRGLATRRDDIAEQLSALETDGDEPLAKELEDLGSEHHGVCDEIRDLEQRLAELKTRRRYLEGRMDDVKNRREAGLSGYKNALREVEETVKSFLARPPVKPLDVEALAAGMNEELSPGGIEFLHLRPERRTSEMAGEWWENEVAILERRKSQVDTDRAALEEGIEVWEEVVSLVLDFEADLRKQMSNSVTATNGKGKERELTAAETLKLQYEKINAVVMGLEQRLRIAEDKGWNLLIAAIGAELEAFREAARLNREMLRAAGIAIDIRRDVLREDSGATGSTNNSYHTVNGGSMNLKDLQEHLLDLPNNREDDKEAESGDNGVTGDLVAAHEEVHGKDEHEVEGGDRDGSTVVPALERDTSDNEVPPEFLVEHHDSRG
ncbi:hypothetical protein VPNG_09295 [Cytospora leucostoma]|uniref:Autophagy-related protein 28 n=1 Tax=Cytospora leucostoma TaxID=1230097 RepID=A0A423VUZ1_9PEZI|nr:hypothetical protein VPNG_09295 [Cytospora leucostoma]